MLVVLLLVAAPLCCMTASILYSGESMKPGETISWANNQLVMQRDCDLVYYANGRRLWASKTSGMGSDCYCTLQSDGNMVVYDNKGTPLWSSDTKRGQGFYVLIAQKDRNLVIYGTARWATNTTI
ncbi:alpha-D-mannose-specific plant lectins domain-containing protein [Dioscorea alata]|uniref:Alpha-D-mannose-specific plant lectins domain-containing protein n=1 Tax=Dioscorea alata TaxID=55571 RepID=A0ACB7WNF4_DIOAL|nr:alpha-D-mannose-specific plant lectins domain-containing protein [Dioscorea alata]